MSGISSEQLSDYTRGMAAGIGRVLFQAATPNGVERGEHPLPVLHAAYFYLNALRRLEGMDASEIDAMLDSFPASEMDIGPSGIPSAPPRIVKRGLP